MVGATLLLDPGLVSEWSHYVDQATCKVEFASLNFQVETDSHYLGSFIGEATERDIWIANKVDDWVHSIKKLTGAARAYPHSAYVFCSPALINTARMAVYIYNAQHQTLNHALKY